jgi:cysteinyl-tRNA synthetase
MFRGYSAQCLRYSLIAAHYKQQLNFTFNNLAAAKNAIEKLQAFFTKVYPLGEVKRFEIRKWQFLGNAHEALLDDMNTPLCLGNVFKVVNEIAVDSLDKPGREILSREFSTIMYCLGLRLDDRPKQEDVPEEIRKIAEERWQLKLAKDFAKADQLRRDLIELGWAINDSREGYLIEKIDLPQG